MCQGVVNSVVVAICCEIAIHTRWIFDWIAIWIKLLISLVVVTEKIKIQIFKFQILVKSSKYYLPLTHHASTRNGVHVRTHVGTHGLHVIPRR
jgi:hypothetical protein